MGLLLVGIEASSLVVYGHHVAAFPQRGNFSFLEDEVEEVVREGRTATKGMEP